MPISKFEVSLIASYSIFYHFLLSPLGYWFPKVSGKWIKAKRKPFQNISLTDGPKWASISFIHGSISFVLPDCKGYGGWYTWFIDLITYKVLNLARLLSSYIIGKSLCVKVSFIWVGLNSTNSQVEKSLIDSLQQTWIIDSS